MVARPGKSAYAAALAAGRFAIGACSSPRSRRISNEVAARLIAGAIIWAGREASLTLKAFDQKAQALVASVDALKGEVKGIREDAAERDRRQDIVNNELASQLEILKTQLSRKGTR